MHGVVEVEPHSRSRSKLDGHVSHIPLGGPFQSAAVSTHDTADWSRRGEDAARASGSKKFYYAACDRGRSCSGQLFMHIARAPLALGAVFLPVFLSCQAGSSSPRARYPGAVMRYGPLVVWPTAG